MSDSETELRNRKVVYDRKDEWTIEKKVVSSNSLHLSEISDEESISEEESDHEDEENDTENSSDEQWQEEEITVKEYNVPCAIIFTASILIIVYSVKALSSLCSITF